MSSVSEDSQIEWQAQTRPMDVKVNDKPAEALSKSMTSPHDKVASGSPVKVQDSGKRRRCHIGNVNATATSPEKTPATPWRKFNIIRAGVRAGTSLADGNVTSGSPQAVKVRDPGKPEWSECSGNWHSVLDSGLPCTNWQIIMASGPHGKVVSGSPVKVRDSGKREWSECQCRITPEPKSKRRRCHIGNVNATVTSPAKTPAVPWRKTIISAGVTSELAPVLDEWLTREITVGTDFCGMGMPILGLEKLQIPFRHIFACEGDSDASCRRLIEHRFNPASIYTATDILNNDRREAVDLYVFDAPCVKSKCEGSSFGDPNLIRAACKYCLRARPRVIVSMSLNQVTSRKHANILKEVKAALAPHYVLHKRILNSVDYGLRQERRQLYFVAIRKDCYMPLARDKTRGQTGFCWPPGSTRVKPDIDAFLDPKTECDTWKRLPDKSPMNRRKYDECRKQELVKTAIRKLQAAGLHPERHPTFVNMCSKGARSRTNEMCTMTRSHCERFGYWVTSRGRPVTLSELCRFQGADLSDFGNLDECRVSRSQFASMLGASTSLPVIMSVLKHAIAATSWD